jgi:hypothetical protein
VKKHVKRLSLNVETVLRLDPEALRDAVGGLSQTGCTTRRPPCEQSFVATCLC